MRILLGTKPVAAMTGWSKLLLNPDGRGRENVGRGNACWDKLRV